MCYIIPKLAHTIGAGHSSVKHVRKVAEVYDSDLIKCLGFTKKTWHPFGFDVLLATVKTTHTQQPWPPFRVSHNCMPN